MNFRFNTDETMRELWSNLARDFRSWTYDELGSRHEKYLRAGMISSFRNEPWPDKLNAPVYICKAQYQLELLFKRYRFQHDEFTDDELLDRAARSFKATQERISHPILLTPVTNRIIEGARQIISDVLGEFSEDELMLKCRVGKKATWGNPLHRSYLDVKLQDGISGSTEQIAWFKQYIATDHLMERAILDCQEQSAIKYRICDTLKGALVEKSYKALRLILPNTFIGAFRTAGLGQMITDRLKVHCGLDISKLQSIHNLLVKGASRDRKLVTADLTAASDSITYELLERLIPPDWLSELNLGRIPKIELRGEVFHASTFMTMGIGFTFPLQTLVFYALLRSIAGAAEIRGRISVYGDDLIYPRNLHKYVASIFPKLHLIINEGKTYVNTYFRESCGADCYHGSDVRPFNPEGQHQMLCRKRYVVFLYKTINGLLQRWNPLEIPGTVTYLLAEILLVDGKILQVPPSFPDESGLKTNSPIASHNFAPVRRSKTIQGFSFSYLRVVNGQRVVLKQSPYYWEKLQLSTASCMDEEVNPYDIRLKNNDGHREYLKSLTDCVDTFLWVKIKNRPLPKKYNNGNKVTYRLTANVHHKTKQHIKRIKGSTSVWA